MVAAHAKLGMDPRTASLRQLNDDGDGSCGGDGCVECPSWCSMLLLLRNPHQCHPELEDEEHDLNDEIQFACSIIAFAGATPLDGQGLYRETTGCELVTVACFLAVWHGMTLLRL